ncbi:MAG TPA: aminomethyl-transferring glycine dehydrogenase subunit GcvPB [Actinomycetota bacterium]|nr:aminomethyl-transferring glycine dehydrogenase subunit GcvPB [Actinomycetota bacterium]
MTGAPVRTQDPPTSTGTIAELSRRGRRAFSFPRLDVPPVEIPSEQARATPAGLPEVAEREIVSHYTRLSQRNYGVDTGVYPLGSCSMKYNPKIGEVAAALPGFRRLHPLQPDHTVQGALELLWRLERALCEITGMARATLQPPAGACGELTGLLLMRAHHTRQGNPRRRVAIPDSAHGTNPASVRMAGYEALHIPSDARGLVDVSALEKLLDGDVAGLMLTNPNTLGLFEEEIEKIAAVVHGVGGLVYYDGANLNAILGRCRPGDMGFDIVHINTHKTFATPHGGGGPGAGPVAVTEELARYLPRPLVARNEDGSFRLETDGPDSIGRMHGFLGNFGILVRAYAYVLMHGRDGLKEVAERSVLNANYLAGLIRSAFPLAIPGRPMHEFVATAKPLRDETGIRALDVAKRIIDLGYHPSTVYFPLIVEEAMMVEPTETETRETLDGLGRAFLQAAEEARTDPELLHRAPVTTPVRRLDEARAARQLKLRW